jgi:prepilin-type N-terminal cleavage/methylation domain-containing protein
MQRKAFTLIELLVVVAISGMLSALAITYSSVGRNAVALSVESSKLTQFILQAKQLSIATYTGSPTACGYGVVLDAAAQTYSIFAYVPNGIASCRSLSTATVATRGIDPNNEEKEYTQGTWQAHLANGVIMQSPGGNNLVTVLFYPPTPTVFLSSDGTTFSNPGTTLTVNLITADGQNSQTISVNPEGQVNL